MRFGVVISIKEAYVNAPLPKGRSRVLREIIYRTYCINSEALRETQRTSIDDQKRRTRRGYSIRII